MTTLALGAFGTCREINREIHDMGIHAGFALSCGHREDRPLALSDLFDQVIHRLALTVTRASGKFQSQRLSTRPTNWRAPIW